MLLGNGQRVLQYMYAAYIFSWPEGCTKLDIGHGSLGEHMGLWTGIDIGARWHPDNLVAFAREWTHQELSRWSS